jgi:hypothetical protein
MNPLVADALSGIVRHLATIAGTYLATKGFIDPNVLPMDQIVGAITTIFGLTASIVDKVVKNKAPATAPVQNQ